VLAGDLGLHHRPLLRHPTLQFRVPGSTAFQTVLRVDDQMLLGLQIFTEPEQPGPLLHLHRTTDNGLFDRFTALHDTLWAEEPEDSNAREELEGYLEYLTETDDDDADDIDSDDDERVPPRSDEHDSPPADVRRTEPPTRRRWPRRPD
jgi:hypothetical protein